MTTGGISASQLTVSLEPLRKRNIHHAAPLMALGLIEDLSVDLDVNEWKLGTRVKDFSFRCNSQFSRTLEIGEILVLKSRHLIYLGLALRDDASSGRKREVEARFDTDVFRIHIPPPRYHS